MKGQGPKQHIASGKEDKHTVLLFDNENAKHVLQAYAELLIETFSEQELRDGTFTAVGMIHRPSEKSDKFPHHIGHYWSEYDPVLTRHNPQPQAFVQYVFAGQGKAKEAGEAYSAVEKMAEGILRLTSIAQGAKTPHRRTYRHRYIMRLLEENVETRDRYEDFVTEFATGNALEKEEWEKRWRQVVREVAETIAGSSLTEEGNSFLEWKDTASDPSSSGSVQSKGSNAYRYPTDNPKVCIQIGSIHSVKGETHTATLVLETFWHRQNLETLLPWIAESQTGWKKVDGARQQTRLKVHYVAMTRPSHLLCLAMKRSSFEDSQGELDQALIQKCKAHGWKDIRVCLV